VCVCVCVCGGDGGGVVCVLPFSYIAHCDGMGGKTTNLRLRTRTQRTHLDHPPCRSVFTTTRRATFTTRCRSSSRPGSSTAMRLKRLGSESRPRGSPWPPSLTPLARLSRVHLDVCCSFQNSHFGTLLYRRSNVCSTPVCSVLYNLGEANQSKVRSLGTRTHTPCATHFKINVQNHYLGDAYSC
jgi:hypothetical protein